MKYSILKRKMQVFLNKIHTFPKSYVVRHIFEISAEGVPEVVILETLGKLGGDGQRRSSHVTGETWPLTMNCFALKTWL